MQEKLAPKVECRPRFGPIAYVAGLYVHIRDDIGRVAAVVVDFNTLKPVDIATAMSPVTFPFKPGLTSFREGPLILEVLERLTIKPDILMFQGQGIDHPRRLGIASHIGVLLDIPTVGYTKTKLFGYHDEVKPTKGDYALIYDSLIYDEGEVIGAAARPHTQGNLLYISIGHRIDLETSLKYVLACCRHYCEPEANRLAERLAKNLSKTPKLLLNGFTSS